jgi:phosphate starvation-inducible PhoH-like protein
MSNKARRHERLSRRKRAEEPVAELPTESIVQPTQTRLMKLEPANPRQKQLLAMLREGRAALFAQGSSGTGKSLIAAYRAAELLREKKIEKVYLVRANVSTGKSSGSLPGTLEEKLMPLFKQTLTHLGKFMGQGFLTYCMNNKVIEFQSVEYIRGMSIENAFVIIEESQNLLAHELEAILTRIGEGSQFVFTGDQKQNDLRGNSGLVQTIGLIERMLDEQPDYLADDDIDCLEQNVGVVTFLPTDVVRSGLCRAFVKMYYHN